MELLIISCLNKPYQVKNSSCTGGPIVWTFINSLCSSPAQHLTCGIRYRPTVHKLDGSQKQWHHSTLQTLLKVVYHLFKLEYKETLCWNFRNGGEKFKTKHPENESEDIINDESNAAPSPFLRVAYVQISEYACDRQFNMHVVAFLRVGLHFNDQFWYFSLYATFYIVYYKAAFTIVFLTS